MPATAKKQKTEDSAALAKKVVTATRRRDLAIVVPKSKKKVEARYVRLVRDKKTVAYIGARSKGGVIGVVQLPKSKELQAFKSVADAAKVVKASLR